MKKGKFIVLYGINNIGKSTQAGRLLKALKNHGYKAERVKYPIYHSEPSGKLINQYLRQGNPFEFTSREFQLLHYIDKANYEKKLKSKLEKGITIIAEDYRGTSVAWGMGTGVNEKLLNYFHNFLYPEDLAILLDGKRFGNGREKNHKHEKDAALVEKVGRAHRKIAKKYGWQLVPANLPIDEVHTIIWNKVKRILK